MRVIKSFIIALSMYSKIPMPRLEWKEEDMKYVFVFFPFVGLVIGALVFAWNLVCRKFELPEILRVFVTAAIPLIITGGIHVDGFMDTMDAFKSYRDKEKKLEILKDPHIGAFSVIMLALYGLVFIGSLSAISDIKLLLIISISFVLSRALSGFCAVSFKSAKEGTLNLFSKNSSGTIVKIFTVLEALISLAAIAYINPILFGIIITTAILTMVYYYFKTNKEFGGITGDTAGYFLLICERNIVVVTGIYAIIASRLGLFL